MSMSYSCLIENMEGFPVNQEAGLHFSTNRAQNKTYYKPPKYT